MRWKVWLQEKWNKPTPEMYYLANIVRWIRLANFKNDKDLDIDDVLLKFEPVKVKRIGDEVIDESPEAQANRRAKMRANQKMFCRMFGLKSDGSGPNKRVKITHYRPHPGAKKKLIRKIT